MRVLVTGGSGFLGAHTVAALLREGHDVTVLDVDEPRHDVPYVLGDVADADVVRKAVAQHDVVCHLAAVADLDRSLVELASTSAANVVGTANVVEAAIEEGVRVVHASTWEVYGPPMYLPVDEDHPCRPEHPYGITKLAAESLVIAGVRFHGLEAVSLRFATIYGRGLRGNSVFEVFRRRARSGKSIVIHGDGSQYRQFLHAEDAADAAIACCIAGDLPGPILNVAPARAVTIAELAGIVSDHYGVPTEFGPPRIADAAPATLSSTRVRAELGWEEKVTFEDGLADLLASDGVFTP